MLTSLQNSKVIEWKKLHKRKYRNRQQRFLVEGFHLVEEAINSQWKVHEVIIKNGSEFVVPDGLEIIEVSEQVFDAISETETPQGVAAVVEQMSWDYTPSSLTLIVDAVQDPGNLGTLIRTADAAGFDHIILGTGTVDPYNDKVIRATQGSIFHIPIFQGDIKEYVPHLKGHDVEIWATTLKGATPYQEVRLPGKVALIVGNEGQGVQNDIATLADEQVYIPIYGQAESLNVAVAAAVLMYHLKN